MKNTFQTYVTSVDGPEISGIGAVRWFLNLACGHSIRITQKKKPQKKMIGCGNCKHEYMVATDPEVK